MTAVGEEREEDELRSLLVDAWEAFDGGDQWAMAAHKIDRLEGPVWTPPFLAFRIERPGGSRRQTRGRWLLRSSNLPLRWTSRNPPERAGFAVRGCGRTSGSTERRGRGDMRPCPRPTRRPRRPGRPRSDQTPTAPCGLTPRPLGRRGKPLEAHPPSCPEPARPRAATGEPTAAGEAADAADPAGSGRRPATSGAVSGRAGSGR